MGKGEKKEFTEVLEPKELYEGSFKKRVNIQEVNHKGKKSYYVRIPTEVIDLMKIKKGDKFAFEVFLKKNPADNEIKFSLG